MSFFRPTVEERANKLAKAQEKEEIRRANLRLKMSKAESRKSIDEAKAELRDRKDSARLAALRREVQSSGRTFAGSAQQPLVEHAETHASPYHHIGPCDAACRAGQRSHAHRSG